MSRIRQNELNLYLKHLNTKVTTISDKIYKLSELEQDLHATLESILKPVFQTMFELHPEAKAFAFGTNAYVQKRKCALVKRSLGFNESTPSQAINQHAKRIYTFDRNFYGADSEVAVSLNAPAVRS